MSGCGCGCTLVIRPGTGGTSNARLPWTTQCLTTRCFPRQVPPLAEKDGQPLIRLEDDMTEERCVYETIGELNRRGSASEAQPRQPKNWATIAGQRYGTIDLLRREVAEIDAAVHKLAPSWNGRDQQPIIVGLGRVEYWLKAANETLAAFDAENKP